MKAKSDILLKSAMMYGLSLGIFWVVKYLFFIFGATMPLLHVVYLGLTLLVPVFAYMLTQRYRLDLGGKISFFHAWRFGIMLYFFAAIIVSIGHFFFFRYVLTPEVLTSSVSQFVTVMKDMQMDSKLIESLSSWSTPPPIHMAIQGIFNNVFFGIIFSLPVAALVCRKENGNEVEGIEA